MNQVLFSESWFDASDQMQKKTQIELDPATGLKQKIIYRWCLCGGGSWLIVETINL